MGLYLCFLNTLTSFLTWFCIFQTCFVDCLIEQTHPEIRKRYDQDVSELCVFLPWNTGCVLHSEGAGLYVGKTRFSDKNVELGSQSSVLILSLSPATFTLCKELLCSASDSIFATEM